VITRVRPCLSNKMTSKCIAAVPEVERSTDNGSVKLCHQTPTGACTVTIQLSNVVGTQYQVSFMDMGNCDDAISDPNF